MANADEDGEHVITGSLHGAKREHTHIFFSVLIEIHFYFLQK